MKWDILHRTRYRYASPVKQSFNEVRLKPLSNPEQTLNTFLLKVLPATRLNHYTDFNLNVVHHFEITEPHTELQVESKLQITTHPRPVLEQGATPWPLARIGEAMQGTRCHEFIGASRFVDDSPETWRLAVEATQGQTDTWQASLAIMRFVREHLTYVTASTSVHTHIRDVLRDKRGVCQDFAHVMIGLCRAMKIPALYVSGYLATEEASATHAWMEVYIPGIGWRALDPTHNRQTDDQYVKIAVGRDYADVAPVAGTYIGTTERKLEVEVKIEKAQ
jgi:transglutaminase-like putative cysteine protease